MKYKLIVLLLITPFFWACAAQSGNVSSGVISAASLMRAAAPVEIPSADPADFEKTFPKSFIMKKSLFVFENTYPRVYVDGGVKAAAGGEKLLAVLKEGAVEFTMPYCSSLVAKGDFTNIRLEGFIATVYGPLGISLFSAEECARFAVHKKLLKGEAAFIAGKLIEWEGSKAVLRDAVSSKILYEGDTGLQIATAGNIDDTVVLVHNNGYITYYDESSGSFALQGSFPVKFNALRYAEGKFYGVDALTGTFFVVTEGNGEVTAYENCRLSFSSPWAFCGGGLLVGFDRRFEGLPEFKSFVAGAQLYAGIDKENLNVYSLKNSWQRFLVPDYQLPSPCMGENGAIYFTGFGGGIYRYSNSKETAAEKRPDKCDAKGVILKGGDFLCGGKKCGLFAEGINKEGEDVMFRRIENGKRYYFFNGLASPDGVN